VTTAGNSHDLQHPQGGVGRDVHHPHGCEVGDGQHRHADRDRRQQHPAGDDCRSSGNAAEASCRPTPPKQWLRTGDGSSADGRAAAVRRDQRPGGRRATAGPAGTGRYGRWPAHCWRLPPGCTRHTARPPTPPGQPGTARRRVCGCRTGRRFPRHIPGVSVGASRASPDTPGCPNVNATSGWLSARHRETPTVWEKCEFGVASSRVRRRGGPPRRCCTTWRAR